MANPPGNVWRLARAAARRRLASRLVSAGGVALVAGSAAALIIAGASKLPVLPDPWRVLWPAFAGGAFGLSALLGGLIAWRSRWTPERAAVELDASLGLKDRLANSLALAPRVHDDPFAALAVGEGEQAASALKPADVHRAVPVRWGNAWTAWPLLAAGAVALGIFAPSFERASVAQPATTDPIQAAAEIKEDVKSAAVAARETLDAVAPDATDRPDLRAVEDLEKELASETPTRDAITEKAARAAESLKSAADELEERSRDSHAEADEVRERLASASGKGESEGSTDPSDRAASGSGKEAGRSADELLDAMKSGELDRAAKAAKELRDEASQMSPEEREAAARRLRDYADLLEEQDAQRAAEQARRERETRNAEGSPPGTETTPPQGTPKSGQAPGKAEQAEPAGASKQGDAGRTEPKQGDSTPEGSKPQAPPESTAQPKSGDQQASDRSKEPPDPKREPETSASEKQGEPTTEPDPKRRAAEETRRLSENLRNAANELSGKDAKETPNRPDERPMSERQTQNGAPTRQDQKGQPSKDEPSESPSERGEPRKDPNAPASESGQGGDQAKEQPKDGSQEGQPKNGDRPSQTGQPSPASEQAGEQPKGTPGEKPQSSPGESPSSSPQQGDAGKPEGAKPDASGKEGTPPSSQGPGSQQEPRGEKTERPDGAPDATTKEPGGQDASKQPDPSKPDPSKPDPSKRDPSKQSPSQQDAPKQGEQPSPNTGPGAPSQPQGQQPQGQPGPKAPGAQPQGGTPSKIPPGVMPPGSQGTPQEAPPGTPPDSQQTPGQGMSALEKQLEQLAKKNAGAARDEKSARELRKRAEDLYNAASPEEKKRLEKLAREFGGSDHRDGKGGGAGSGDGTQRDPAELPEWSGPTKSVDATRPAPVRPSDVAPREQVLSQLENSDRTASADGKVGHRVMEDRVHEAAAGAQRALEQDTVPRRHRDLVRRVFQRYLPEGPPVEAAPK